MSAIPALALAVALTYVIGDLYRPYLPGAVSILVSGVVCLVLFKVTNHYLKALKE